MLENACFGLCIGLLQGSLNGVEGLNLPGCGEIRFFLVLGAIIPFPARPDLIVSGVTLPFPVDEQRR